MYYISKVLIDNETHYSNLKNIILVLQTVTKKLHPYFQAHLINVPMDHL